MVQTPPTMTFTSVSCTVHWQTNTGTQNCFCGGFCATGGSSRIKYSSFMLYNLWQYCWEIHQAQTRFPPPVPALGCAPRYLRAETVVLFHKRTISYSPEKLAGTSHHSKWYSMKYWFLASISLRGSSRSGGGCLYLPHPSCSDPGHEPFSCSLQKQFPTEHKLPALPIEPPGQAHNLNKEWRDETAFALEMAFLWTHLDLYQQWQQSWYCAHFGSREVTNKKNTA